MVSASSHNNPTDQLLRQACEELRRRLAAGQSCSSEELFQAFPILASDPDRAVQLIQAEWRSRKERGEQPDRASWLARFPDYRERLEPLLQDQPTLSRSHAVEPGTVDSGLPASILQTTPEYRQPGGKGTDPELVSGARLSGLPRHERREVLGRGAMGVVYRAWDTALQRPVALKMLNTGVLAEPQEVERFCREAQAAARLDHPNIVRVFDIGLHDGQHFYTMTLATGGSLAEHRARYAEPRAAAALVEKIARAVGEAHAQGIVHRDLKPGNILFNHQAEPLVSDFGLVKLPDAGRSLTRLGDLVGTPAYMAPEQAAGHGHRTCAASDVWSLGVILYEVLTGQLPFPARNVLALTQEILEKDPSPLSSIKPSLPRDLQTIIGKCLEKSPERRYPSATALADDLRAWLEDRPISARAEPWARRLVRKLRRWQAARVASLLLGWALLVPLALYLWMPAPAGKETPKTPQEEALALHLRDLASGRAVTLVDGQGRLSTSRWINEPQRRALDPPRQGFLDLLSYGSSLLELIPDPQQPHFRLSLEVQVEKADVNRDYAAGLFFGCDETATPVGPAYRFAYLTLGGGVDRPQGMVQLGCYSLPEAPEPAGGMGKGDLLLKSLDIRPSFPVLALGTLATPGPGLWGAVGVDVAGGERATEFIQASWHRLRVEVTPEGFQTWWNEQALPWVSWDKARPKVDWWWRMMKPSPGGLTPPLLSRAPLGLYVRNGAAKYRNVVLEP